MTETIEATRFISRGNTRVDQQVRDQDWHVLLGSPERVHVANVVRKEEQENLSYTIAIWNEDC